MILCELFQPNLAFAPYQTFLSLIIIILILDLTIFGHKSKLETLL